MKEEIKMFYPLTAGVIDCFTQEIKNKFGKEIKANFESYEPDENDDFFFWVDRIFLFESDMIETPYNYKIDDKLGIVHRVFKNGEEVGFKMVLNLKNGGYTFYNNYLKKTEKYYWNIIDFIEQL
jgi:hypothetical protein